MRCLDDCHVYELENFIGNSPQILGFYKITKDPEGLLLKKDGTTNEEVLRMLIHRLKFLNQWIGCRENSIAITKLEEALMWLEKRTDDRVQRGVEGKLEP